MVDRFEAIQKTFMWALYSMTLFSSYDCVTKYFASVQRKALVDDHSTVAIPFPCSVTTSISSSTNPLSVLPQKSATFSSYSLSASSCARSTHTDRHTLLDA